MTDEERHQLCQKPAGLWSDRERSDMYWWFYHEMEVPEEEQLRYWFLRYRSKKWAGFLLETFPTEENYQLISKKAANGAYMRNMLREYIFDNNPSVDLLCIIIKMGPKSCREAAIQLLMKYFNFL